MYMYECNVYREWMESNYIIYVISKQMTSATATTDKDLKEKLQCGIKCKTKQATK